MHITTILGVSLLVAFACGAEHYPHAHPHPHSHPHPHPHPHSHSHGYHPYPHQMSRNQRIIKVHGPPHHHSHHGHHKHIRPGPLGPHLHYSERDNDQHYEYIRPNHPPPVPPFHGGSSSGSNHIKHFPRPPPHVHYKSPSYGSSSGSGSGSSSSSYPHKTTSFRAPVVKEPFRGSAPIRTSSLEYPSSPFSHIHHIDDNKGPIHEIPAPNLGPKPNGEHHPSKDEYLTNLGKGSNEVSKHIKETYTEHGPGYEVTENNHPTNDHVIESVDGSKSYYAPDPDPSLPVHKVPPTQDPHSIPSDAKKFSDVYIPQVAQDFQILDGGSVPSPPIAPLSHQELYDLMHGFPNQVLQQTLVQQPVVTILSQPQPPNVIIPPEVGHEHYPHPPVGDAEHYVHQVQQHGNDIGYLQQDLGHTSHSHQTQANNGLLHSAVVDHTGSPQHADYPQEGQQYHIQVQDFNQPQYQSFNYDEKNPHAGAVPMENYQTQIDHNYQYEPEASESQNSAVQNQLVNSKSDSVKKYLLPDSAGNRVVDNQIEDELAKTGDKSPIFELKNQPEVPYYTVLPNRQAAEALATLQAAGSIGSSYVNQIKHLRGDQIPVDEQSEDDASDVQLGLPEEAMLKPQKINYNPTENVHVVLPTKPEQTQQEKNVEVQKSIPLYEASYVSTGLTQSDQDVPQRKEDAQVAEHRQDDEETIAFSDSDLSEKFGRRLRPK